MINLKNLKLKVQVDSTELQNLQQWIESQSNKVIRQTGLEPAKHPSTD